MIDTWLKKARNNLVGRTIIGVSRYKGEDQDFENQLQIHLDDGEILFASQDEEGNRGGVIFTNMDPGMYI